jgi:hypothetical protein
VIYPFIKESSRQKEHAPRNSCRDVYRLISIHSSELRRQARLHDTWCVRCWILVSNSTLDLFKVIFVAYQVFRVTSIYNAYIGLLIATCLVISVCLNLLVYYLNYLCLNSEANRYLGFNNLENTINVKVHTLISRDQIKLGSKFTGERSSQTQSYDATKQNHPQYLGALPLHTNWVDFGFPNL